LLLPHIGPPLLGRVEHSIPVEVEHLQHLLLIQAAARITSRRTARPHTASAARRSSPAATGTESRASAARPGSGNAHTRATGASGSRPHAASARTAPTSAARPHPCAPGTTGATKPHPGAPGAAENTPCTEPTGAAKSSPPGASATTGGLGRAASEPTCTIGTRVAAGSRLLTPLAPHLGHFGAVKFSVSVGIESTDQLGAVRPPGIPWGMRPFAIRVRINRIVSRFDSRCGRRIGRRIGGRPSW
jgi:hypothetical protein